MGLVNDSLVPGNAGATFVSPREGGVDDAGFRDEGCTVTFVKGQVFIGMADGVAKHGVVPLQGADELPGVRVEQELVWVEAVARLRLVGPMNAKAVHGA